MNDTNLNDAARRMVAIKQAVCLLLWGGVPIAPAALGAGLLFVFLHI